MYSENQWLHGIEPCLNSSHALDSVYLFRHPMLSYAGVDLHHTYRVWSLRQFIRIPVSLKPDTVEIRKDGNTTAYPCCGYLFRHRINIHFYLLAGMMVGAEFTKLASVSGYFGLIKSRFQK